jgi:hypothetical protein
MCYTGQHAKSYPYMNGITNGSTVSNINGTLTCDVAAHVPPGSYLNSCKLYAWNGVILSATCKGKGKNNSSINSFIISSLCRKFSDDYLHPWIINVDGSLTCG